MIRKRFTYANVMSTIAVFLALGLGGAWAAQQLKKNSVSTKQVKNESLKSKDLKDGKGVTGADVVDGSLGGADLKDGSVAGGDIATNAISSAKIADGSVAPADVAPVDLHVLGEPGEPDLSAGGEGDCVYANIEDGFNPDSNPAGFYRDSSGVVHLFGFVGRTEEPSGDGSCGGGTSGERIEDATIFVLPPGYRPDHVENQVGYQPLAIATYGLKVTGDTDEDTPTTLTPAGSVLPVGPESEGTGEFSLDGISFRAAP